MYISKSGNFHNHYIEKTYKRNKTNYILIDDRYSVYQIERSPLKSLKNIWTLVCEKYSKPKGSSDIT